jgi:deazaflavin-dependent oxidoreductase (nitroreductase family)
MRIRRSVAKFNRVVTNRIHGLWAWLIPPMSVIIHTGRRSGKTYRTPLMASRRGEFLVIALPLGEGSDWVRNLIAAHGGEVMRGGRRRLLREPRVLDRHDDQVPRGARWTVLPLPTRKVFVGRMVDHDQDDPHRKTA